MCSKQCVFYILHVTYIYKLYYIYICISSHPNHIKRSIVYSQSLRARGLHSVESDFLKHCTKKKSWFLKKRLSRKHD